MITEGILNILFSLVDVFLSLLPSINFTFPSSIINGGAFLFNMTGYFFPVAGVMPLITFGLMINLFKLTMSIIVRVKSFFPTMGG